MINQIKNGVKTAVEFLTGSAGSTSKKKRRYQNIVNPNSPQEIHEISSSDEEEEEVNKRTSKRQSDQRELKEEKLNEMRSTIGNTRAARNYRKMNNPFTKKTTMKYKRNERERKQKKTDVDYLDDFEDDIVEYSDSDKNFVPPPTRNGIFLSNKSYQNIQDAGQKESNRLKSQGWTTKKRSRPIGSSNSSKKKKKQNDDEDFVPSHQDQSWGHYFPTNTGQTRKSKRINQQKQQSKSSMYTDNNYDESPIRRSKRHTRSAYPKTKPKSVLIWPQGDANCRTRDVVTITDHDICRLQEGEFLNDSLIDFALRRFLFKVEQSAAVDGLKHIHVFSTFFYKRLLDIRFHHEFRI